MARAVTVPGATPRSLRSGRIEVRTDAEQDELIRQAAALEHKTVTAFVLDTATERAREVLAERRDVVLSAEAFDRFAAALDEPARVVPELADLFTRQRRGR
jgi:uncharacterized protein (DUF1778 family)